MISRNKFIGAEERHRTWNMATVAILSVVRLYRKAVSPLFKPRCKYIPTCSEYFEQAVAEYGFLRGSMKGVMRILRCNPFSRGGYDPLT